MAVGPNDVNILSVAEKNNDADAPAGQPIELIVKTEVGETLFNSGAAFQVGVHVVDESIPANVFSMTQNRSWGPQPWAPVQVFTYTVPAANTVGRETHMLRLQAYVIGNKAGPRDASSAASGSLLLTP